MLEQEKDRIIWRNVLLKLRKVKDFGRLEGTNKLFQAIVVQDCWPQVRALSIEFHQPVNSVSTATVRVDGHRFSFKPFKFRESLPLLLESLSRKASKLETLELKFKKCSADHVIKNATPFLKILEEILAPLKEIRIRLQDVDAGLKLLPLKSDKHPVAEEDSLCPYLVSLLNQQTKSLGDFSISISDQSSKAFDRLRRFLLQLSGPLRSCNALESFRISVDHSRGSIGPFLGEVLQKKSKLKKLVIGCSLMAEEDRKPIAEALVNCGARLTCLEVDGCLDLLLGDFLALLQMADQGAHNPLASVQELATRQRFSHRMFQACPNVRLIKKEGKPVYETLETLSLDLIGFLQANRRHPQPVTWKCDCCQKMEDVIEKIFSTGYECSYRCFFSRVSFQKENATVEVHVSSSKF